MTEDEDEDEDEDDYPDYTGGNLDDMMSMHEEFFSEIGEIDPKWLVEV